MGLASKLQAAQAGAAPYGAPGGAPAGTLPSAPPMPPAQAGPAAAAGPYATPGAPVAPYPPQGPGSVAAAAAASGTFPAPYPGGSAPPGMPGQPAPYGAARPPYSQQPGPMTGPGGTAPYPGAPYQQQQQQLMPGAAPGPYPPGQMMPGQPQQQHMQMASSAPYPSAQQATPGQYPQQQQPYGAPPPAAPAGGLSGSIAAKLSACVAANGLNRFYPPQALSSLASRLESRVNFRELAARWSMPVELALDLAQLALYDIVLLADDSGSMAFEENGERIDDLKMIAQKVSEVATLFDDDGILVRFMNSNVQGNGIRSASDVGSLLAGVSYSGLTPLATSLRDKVLGPIVFSLAGSGQLAKPVLVITITDGEPTDNPKDLVVQVIKDAQARLAAQYGPKAIAFEFCQVGKDQRAQAFLAELDSHPQVGGSIDCTSYYELECVEYQRRGINLSPSMWLVKMMVGAVDMSHDKGDER